MKKVPESHIKAMLATLTYKFSRVADTNTTVCVAMLPGNFRVGTGDSVCLNDEDFHPGIGEDCALLAAMDDAKKNLWMLESYILKTTGQLSIALPLATPKRTNVNQFSLAICNDSGEVLCLL